MNMLLSFAVILPFISLIRCEDWPRVTILFEGIHEVLNSSPEVSKATGSVTLVQSNGKNILADTGTTNLADFLNITLWNISGLRPQDINLTFVTHTHPDHYSNLLLFSNEQSQWTSNITGNIFAANPLQSGNNYYLFNDKSLEVWLTPGHTPQDCTLLVHNWNNTQTTIGIVGDLFFNSSDTVNPSLWQSMSNNVQTQEESRRKVACAVSYIIPGHGPMFKVTNDIKANVFSCNSALYLYLHHLLIVFIFCILFIF